MGLTIVLVSFTVLFSLQLAVIAKRKSSGWSKPTDDSKRNKNDEPKSFAPVKPPSTMKPKAPQTGPAPSRKDKSKWEKDYSDYLAKYKKPADRLQDESRMAIFQINVEEVYRHNNEYLAKNVTWWKGINFFSDMIYEELVFYMGYFGDTYGPSDPTANASRVRRSPRYVEGEELVLYTGYIREPDGPFDPTAKASLLRGSPRDMKEEELVLYTGYITDPDGPFDPTINARRVRRSPLVLPEAFDYRNYGVISPVKDQGDCGCCFAFAAVGCMESKLALKYKSIKDLSEQHIVDCSKSYGNKGCNGGNFEHTFKFMTEVGVPNERNIPYKGKEDTCNAWDMKYNNRVVKFKAIETDEESMRAALIEHGPIVASITVDRDFFSYEGGVFSVKNESTPNHAVVVVGYGKENGIDVWFIKNSWGESWGQEGFMAIQRNVNLRQIADSPFAIVSVSRASVSQTAAWVVIIAFNLFFCVDNVHPFSL